MCIRDRLVTASRVFILDAYATRNTLLPRLLPLLFIRQAAYNPTVLLVATTVLGDICLSTVCLRKNCVSLLSCTK